jgi:6-phosphogluconolactonase
MPPFVLRVARLVAITACIAGCAAPRPEASRVTGDGAQERFVYVGTYTAPAVAPEGHQPSTARGIYVFKMRATDGHLELVQIVPTDNPSYLALDPTQTHLYCVNQLSVEAAAGRVSAFSIDATGRLTFLDAQSTHGSHPAHLSVHPSGRYLLASNYGEGDYPVHRILEDGSIGAQTADARGSGTGPDAERQGGPHAHQIVTDPDGRHVFGVDLGADKILAWQLDVASGALTASATVGVAPGSGPRHMVFHPNRRFAYVLNELAASITTFRYDADRGRLEPSQTISTLPPGFTGPKSGAEIRIHPSGRFLYSTNRGHDSIAMFTIDPSTGALASLGWVPTQGETPRGMNVDPSGTFLYAANQNSDTIVVFRVDTSSGKLTPTGESVHTPNPVDIAFGGLRPGPM